MYGYLVINPLCDLKIEDVGLCLGGDLLILELPRTIGHCQLGTLRYHASSLDRHLCLQIYKFK